VELLMRFHTNNWLLDYPTNIRLGWKQEAEANALAYYSTATTTTVKVL
jgi:hypothetical protein